MKRYITSIATGVFLLAAFVPSTSTHAQLQEVKQTVYGMDCAPCAYAQENRLKAMEGVRQASVSLNQGLATLQLAADNEITLERIRQAVRKSGFSPEETTLTLQGRLVEDDGQWILTTPTEDSYRLEGALEMLPRTADQRLTVTGTVPKGEKPISGWTLEVTALDTEL